MDRIAVLAVEHHAVVENGVHFHIAEANGPLGLAQHILHRLPKQLLRTADTDHCPLVVQQRHCGAVSADGKPLCRRFRDGLHLRCWWPGYFSIKSEIEL